MATATQDKPGEVWAEQAKAALCEGKACHWVAADVRSYGDLTLYHVMQTEGGEVTGLSYNVRLRMTDPSVRLPDERVGRILAQWRSSTDGEHRSKRAR